MTKLYKGAGEYEVYLDSGLVLNLSEQDLEELYTDDSIRLELDVCQNELDYTMKEIEDLDLEVRTLKDDIDSLQDSLKEKDRLIETLQDWLGDEKGVNKC